MDQAAPTLIIGIGNPTRQDDGAGMVLAEQLEALVPASVEIQTAQQLTPEMALDWADRQRVLVLDAAVDGDPVTLMRLQDQPDSTTEIRTHNAHPASLATLARQLLGRSPDLWVCTMLAQSFDYTTDLTPAMQEHVRAAKEKVLAWIRAEAAAEDTK